MQKNIFYDNRSNSIHLWDSGVGYRKFTYKPYCYILDEEGNHTTMYGDKVKKVNFKKPAEMRDFKESWGASVFESDIRPATRTLIDLYHNKELKMPDINTGFIDIEVDIAHPDYPGGFPTPKYAEAAINAITVYSTRTQRYHLWALRPDSSYEISNDDFGDDVQLHVFNKEAALLQHFIETFGSLDLHIYTGWNSQGFDVPYIFNRAKQLLAPHIIKQLSKIGIIDVYEERDKYLIAGTSHLDYMELCKKFTANMKQSYRLDNIAEEELGEKKLEFKGWLGELYRKDFKTFLEYNKKDVELLVKLDKKLQYIDLARTICYKANIPFEEIAYASTPIEGAILSYLKRKKLISPDTIRYERKGSIAGGYVAEPTSGLHEYVCDFDFTSLYPSIMRSLNISPETKVAKYINNDIALLEGLEEHHAVAINGCVYDNSKRGIIPEIQDVWFAERVEYKRQMKEHKQLKNEATTEEGKKHHDTQIQYYHMLQYTIKIMLNTMYGCLALPSFRFHDRDNAEAITLTGQAAIKHARKAINEMLGKLGSTDRVILVDTDSCYFSLKKVLVNLGVDTTDEKKSVDVILNKIIPTFNAVNKKAMDEFAKEQLHINGTHYFDLKQELIARRIFLYGAKKRYGMKLLNEEGIPVDKYDYKGIDVVRSNFPKFFKESLTTICEMVLDGKGQDELQATIKELQKKVKSQSLNVLANPVGVKNLKPLNEKGIPIHVRAAGVYNKMIADEKLKTVMPIRNGDKLRWVYLIESNPWHQHCIGFTEETPKEILDRIEPFIDYDIMIHKNLLEKVKQPLDAAGFQMPEKLDEGFEGFFTLT